MSSKTYIYLATVFIVLACLTYIGVMAIPGVNDLSAADNLFYDRIYYHATNIYRALFCVGALYMAVYITSNEQKHLATTVLKALLLFIVGWQWVRMVFNFFVNETITSAELTIDVIILLITAVRAYYKWINEHT